ncbi:MAG: hypothetical protein WDN28_07520 [Chthoniobacter sp.]
MEDQGQDDDPEDDAHEAIADDIEVGGRCEALEEREVKGEGDLQTGVGDAFAARGDQPASTVTAAVSRASETMVSMCGTRYRSERKPIIPPMTQPPRRSQALRKLRRYFPRRQSSR